MAKKADAVIFCGGLNHQYDVEGYDRQDMKLPDGQDELIAEIAKVNQNLALLMISGSPYEMPWINSVPALLQGWYAGMECGNAFADILFGKISPSGKLAMTFPKSLNDCPAHSIGSYEEDCSEYNEDVYVGYRYYDKQDIEPLFVFGHGLSFSKFVLSELKIEQVEDDLYVSVNLKNTGKINAKETVQFYVEDLCSKIDRPYRELRAYKKVFLLSLER